MSRKLWVAELSLVGMSVIWGLNYSVVKYATGVVPPLAYNTTRIFLAAAALAVVARLWGGTPPAIRDAVALIALGVLGNGVYQVFFIEGVARTRAGEAALVVGASPALIALFGAWRGVERLNVRAAVGIAVSIAGVGLIVLGRATSGDTAQGGSVLGDLLVLCGSTCWALYTVLLTPYLKRVTGWWISAMTMFGGALVLLFVGTRSIIETSWHTLPAGAWMAIAYSGLGSLVVAYMLWYYGVRTVGPTRTALYGNLQPLVALIAAWLMLGETPTLWQYVGAASILGGVLLTRVQASEAT